VGSDEKCGDAEARPLCVRMITSPRPSLPPQTLKTLRQVEVINFGDCLVRSKGAVAIADAVRGGLPKLKVLAFPLVWGVGVGGV
jgi:hypothetical protein